MTTLQEWAASNPVGDEMLWKKGAEYQTEDFGRVGEIFRCDPEVVSTHTSKSITLPVVEFRRGDLRMICRNNFHDIKVSVWSPRPIDHDLWGLTAFVGDGYLNPVYFEGFKGRWDEGESWVHPPFVRGATRFSAGFSPDPSRGFETFAKLLVWQVFGGSEPVDPLIEKETEMRRIALEEGFPVIVRKDSVSGLFRFFNADFPPNFGKLEEAIRVGAPRYNGKIEHLPYATLDFTSGCPKPEDDWLQALSKIVRDRRNDKSVSRLGNDIGQEVKIQRVTPDLRERMESLGIVT